MDFAAPLGLLGLVAVPAVVALHLFRRRFVERRVAGLFLFSPDALASTAGRRRTRLLRTPSLWLECLAALALGLLLARPRIGSPGERAHLVVVLDGSASMTAPSATGSAGASSADAARAF